MNKCPGSLVAERYVLESLLGRGGMGEVWKARDLQSGDLVALKWVLPAPERAQEMQLRWAREADALHRLQHPNIVKLLQPAHTYPDLLVMEWAPGGSLRQRVGSAQSHQQILPICLDLVDALTRAHRLGIVHRDLKPENILLAADGSVRLGDFGIAHLGDLATLTEEGALMGTVPYLSPEACRGEAASPAQDVWALGVILFELLTGQRPFQAPTAWELIQAIIGQEAPDPIQKNPSLPSGWADLLKRLLHKDPHCRICSARALGAELEALQDLEGSAPGQPQPEPGETQSLASRLHLPDESTPWVGRESYLQQVFLAFQSRPLVTLVGPGGMGKSRLARELATRHLADFGGAIYWVPLASLFRAEEVPVAVAEALRFPFAGQLSPPAQVAQRLSGLGPCLLILDNYEQLTHSSSLLVGWLNQAPDLKILVTSRRPLRLAQEMVVTLKGLQPQEAADLFVECCQSHGYTQSLSPELVKRVVAATQALPLALELAAGQMGTLSLAELAEELERSLELLDSGYLDRDQRERGLEAIFASSWENLTPSAQAQLAELSYFRGGFSKEASAEVVRAGLPALVQLADHSLVKRQPGGRFEVHEQIRQLAIRRLPGQSDIARRHAVAMASWMDRLQVHIRSLTQPLSQTLRQVEEEQANLRLAWTWIHDTDQWHLWGGSWYGWLTFFDLTGRNQEFESDFLIPVLRACPSGPSRGGWLLARAVNLNRLGQGPEGLSLFEEALAALDTPQTLADRAYGLVQRALITQNRDPSDTRSQSWVEEALPTLRQHRFATGLSLAYTCLAVASWIHTNDRHASQQWLKQALQQVGENPHPTGRLNLHWAQLALSQGDVPSARSHAQQGMELAASVHDHFYHAYAQALLGQACVLEQKLEEAETLLLDSLEESWKYQLLTITQLALLGFAELLCAQGQALSAGPILGALEPGRLPWSARQTFQTLSLLATPQPGSSLAGLVEPLLHSNQRREP